MPKTTNQLPIIEHLPTLLSVLTDNNLCVLEAPPGAGKTTQVPLAIHRQSWLGGQKIIMLEPRRIAARNVARFMAKQLNETLAETVGYRLKLDSKVGPNTQIEIVTEGILIRMLQDDPTLEGVGCIIFDEFHERSLQADLGLALTLEAQQLFNQELRILIMSATLDSESISNAITQFLACVVHNLDQHEQAQHDALVHSPRIDKAKTQQTNVPIVRCPGRSFEVKTHYLNHKLPPVPHYALVDNVTAAIHQAIIETEGNILCFLPGSGEIRRVYDALSQRSIEQKSLPNQLQISPLYGALKVEQQDQAIAPPPKGYRKLVLATDIAETSLTIEGVSVVIDTGLSRKPQFNPRSGMSALTTQNISQASATQRRGRAGRLMPGVCYRLWGETQQQQLAAQPEAEILHADLAPLVLELAQWGSQIDELCWIDRPPQAHVDQAQDLLTQLQALNQDGKITPMGTAMVKLGTHPRLAHMMIQSAELGLTDLACDLAALLGERDIFSRSNSSSGVSTDVKSGAGNTPADIRLRLEQLQRSATSPSAISKTIRATAQRWKQQLRKHSSAQLLTQPRAQAQTPSALRSSGVQPSTNDATGLLLSFAFPDRIAQRRGSSSRNYRLRNGRGARFIDPDSLANSAYIVIANLDGKGADARIFLAAPITEATLLQHFEGQIEQRTEINWDEQTQSIQARKRQLLGSLILDEQPISQPDAAQISTGMLSAIRTKGLQCLPWNKQSSQLLARLQLMATYQISANKIWPDYTDAGLLEHMEQWLAPYIEGFRKLDQLKQLDLTQLLLNRLDWPQQQFLQQQLPTHIKVPSGSNIMIDYQSREEPLLSVRIQELFGLEQSPRLLNGQIAVTIQLLSPAQRPIQITQDLASFWQMTYPEVCKDLKGRYPKHYWPEDPKTAQATRGTKKQMQKS